MSPIHRYQNFEQLMMRRPPGRRMDEIAIYLTENNENMRKAGDHHNTTYEEAISEVLGMQTPRVRTIMTGYRILVASYTDRITSLLFDPTGPSLKVTSEVKVGARPSWLTVHPSDPSLIFTGLENLEGVVVALKYDNDGNGTIVGQIPSGGADPASLLATTDTLFVGNVRARRFLP